MPMDLRTLEERLRSSNKDVRLKALKLILRHPDSSPLQLVQCLCSEDNRNFEFVDEYGLGPAMRDAWDRIEGVEQEDVYDFLDSLYTSNPEFHVHNVVHILQVLQTQRSLKMLRDIRDTAPAKAHMSIDGAITGISGLLPGTPYR